MKTVNIMLKPASSLCNMRCKYCFYADVSAARNIPSYGIMSAETVEALLKRLAAEFSRGDRIGIAFQGGEPTLAGLSFFRDFVEKASSILQADVSYALQTNGLLLDDEWRAFLKEHRFLVGLSLDLLPEIHDSVRVDSAGDGTYKRVTESLALLKKHGIDCNVLCTLTNTAARHPKQIWNQLVRLGIDYMQFTPCLGKPDGTPSNHALTPRRFASFYKQLFTCWYEDFQKGNRRSVKFFDDIVNQIILGRPTQCGMDGACQPQLVIEADGSAYPCDFYCLDKYKLGNITEQTVSALLASDALTSFIKRPHETPALCDGCPYYRFCGGNCKRMQCEICCSGADSYCGYRDFLDSRGAILAHLADTSLRAYRTQSMNR